MRSPVGVILILCGLAIIQAGCAPDAPHDNPLDPQSPNYKSTGRLTGEVLTLSIPYLGVSGALVTVEQNGDSRLTSLDGTFGFSDAPSGNLSITFSKAGYLSDTLSFTLPVGGSHDCVVHLDALPQITGAQVMTAKIDQWWPGPVYSATVTANISDPDGIGDIVDSTVRVQIDSLSFNLVFSGGTSNFSATINASQLPNQDLQWLVGKPLYISALDRENGKGSAGPFFVTRIIEPEPAPTYPASLADTTGPHPTFEWNPPSVSYSYNYFLQVYQVNAGIPSQVGTTIVLDPSYVSYTYSDSLAPGQYFWTIGITDQYGNTSRSKEASFVVP